MQTCIYFRAILETASLSILRHTYDKLIVTCDDMAMD